MNILYIASSDPNSFGFILKQYWEKFGLGTFHQLTKRGPSMKQVDICINAPDVLRGTIHNGKERDINESAKFLGELVKKADVIHFDRPSELGLANIEDKAHYFPVEINGKRVSWLSIANMKPCVFGHRGSTLLRRYGFRTDWQFKEFFAWIPHALNVYTNPHLSGYLPPDSRFLPFCGNDEMWSKVKPHKHKRFTIAQCATGRKDSPGWLSKFGNRYHHIEDLNDFKHGTDAIGDLERAVYQVNAQTGSDIQVIEITKKTYEQSLQVIADCDVLFHNYRMHGSYGWSAVEAMFYGKPVLNGTNEIFLNTLGNTPFLETHNSEQLKQNIITLYNSSETYEHYRNSSNKWYAKFHDAKAVIYDYLVPIYEKAVERFDKHRKGIIK